MRKLVMSAMISGAMFSAAANAHESGDFFVRIGAAHVAPDSSSGSVILNGGIDSGGGVEVEDNTGLGFSGTWFVGKNLGIEVLAALPFEHDIVGTGTLEGVDIGSTKHLPPTVSLHYYPFPDSTFQPYFGVGINYTMFFSSETDIAENAELELDDSVGVAFQVGVDWKLSDNFYLNAGVWKVDIGTTADISVEGEHFASVDVDIDPMVFMLGVGFTF